MASLTTAAARRALSCRGALPRVGHPRAAAAAFDRDDGARAIAIRHGACPASISWGRAANDARRCPMMRRPLSSGSAGPTLASGGGGGGLGSGPSDDVRTPPRRRPSDEPNDGASNDVSDVMSSGSLAPLTEEEYNPLDVDYRIFRASRWDQGRWDRGGNNKSRGRGLPDRKKHERQWDYDYVREAVDDYERHLRYVYDRIRTDKGDGDGEGGGKRQLAELLSNVHPSKGYREATQKLLSAKTLANAVRALTRSRMDTPILSQRIRDIERLVGLIGWTPITEGLSYRLLEANGKAGNVRRTLALLELRRRRGYVPREQPSDFHDVPLGFEPGEREFVHAVTSVKAAQLDLRRSRNIYLHESMLREDSLDNPTRYLDAILLNMSQRGVPLRPEIASRMLGCYSAGRTGKALHYFYKAMRDSVEEDGTYVPGPHPTHLEKDELDEWKEARMKEGMGRKLASGPGMEGKDESPEDASSKGTVVRMRTNPPPPFSKVPSKVRDAALAQGRDHRSSTFVHASKRGPSSSSEAKTKYEWEADREWSLSLTAAFAFADSLTHGACGHDPIELDVAGWNCLVKACCHRGAFHRAMKLLDETMPQRGVEPDGYSYNTILSGLARVGDVTLMKEYLTKMTNKGVKVNKYTSQAMADGLLNVGDISGASTVVQDVFNQHDALPPYTTHLKIIEFALSNGLLFEAKRHVYFVQQLWKWQPSKHHSEQFVNEMEAVKHHPKLSREALKMLFRHFHEELQDGDFF